MNRRNFLSTPALAAFQPSPSQPRKIAAIVTEYRPLSHADVIVGKYLEGLNQDDRPPYPRSKIVSLFTEQVPQNDMSRERAAKYKVPIYRTVAEALTLGGYELAVDGVLLIGEHGDYPTNDKAQKLYPRFEMFLKIADVFRQARRSVPVFNDKHLSWSFRQAQRMVDISRELKFPLLAGSSVPVAYRVPAVDTPFGAPQRHAVAVGYGGIDAYGFHMLEALQCMVERRKGGETGVRSVKCLERQDCWKFLEQNGWAKQLLDEALSHSQTRKPGEMRDLVKDPLVYLIDYRDGLEAAAFMLTGLVADFTVAVDVDGQSRPVSTLMKLQTGRPHHHFGCLIEQIERMFATGTAPYPVERTLLSGGVLDFALESRLRGYARVDTPGLGHVRYQPPAQPRYCTKGWGPDGKRIE